MGGDLPWRATLYRPEGSQLVQYTHYSQGQAEAWLGALLPLWEGAWGAVDNATDSGGWETVSTAVTRRRLVVWEPTAEAADPPMEVDK